MQSTMLTVFDGDNKVIEVDLSSFGKAAITFGREAGNDIVIPSSSRIVSRNHGIFSFINNEWSVVDNHSTNGIRVNGIKAESSPLTFGDIISIGKLDSSGECIIMVLGTHDTSWNNTVLPRTRPLSIGRSPDNDLCLDSPVVSGYHAFIDSDNSGCFFIHDCNSYNGTYVMGQPIQAAKRLFPGDIVSIALTPMVFTGASLLYYTERRGVEVVAHDLLQVRKTRTGERVTTDHVSLNIKRGDFVAIVGGSGSGKSTLLNELNGTDPASSGNVFIDGIDLYSNYEMLKNAIGYVPQEDIVYDNLRLLDMLCYAAELRMPPDSSTEERRSRALEVLELLDLSKEQDTYIRQLSGGQKKRASIAVELLADPRLIFLDEPTSGLDPGIEQDLMQKLARMASEGRTIILVTHTTLNLDLCSQVVFLGPGGKLCYAGPPKEALSFFETDDFVPIYNKIAANPSFWTTKYLESKSAPSPSGTLTGQAITSKRSPSFTSQLSTLSRRYIKLLFNDRQRLLLLLLQAPLLAGLISIVVGNNCFKICENTTSGLFALSCAAFWVGVLNSIQEICKERGITRREVLGGLNISAYVLSKVLVLGALCFLQSLMLVGVFCSICPPGEESLIMSTHFELFITILLLTFSATCLGLWISALFNSPDRAIAMAPILIMPQVLFSGVVFELKGIAKTISSIVHCRWGMEALGTTANVNDLPLRIYGETVTVPAGSHHIDELEVTVPASEVEYMGQMIPVEEQERTVTDIDVDIEADEKVIDANMYAHEPDDAYMYTLSHLLFDWTILLVFCFACIGLCIATLKNTIRR